MLLVCLFGIITFLSGCNKAVSAPIVEVNQVIDVSQYSQITPNDLITKIGKPLRTDEWTFESPKGQKYSATSYNYEIDHYPIEFIVIKNAIVRMNVYTSENKENILNIKLHKDVLSLSGIIPGKDMTTVIENTVTARYSSVSDDIGEVFATLDNMAVDFLRVTFDTKYFI
jgi:hypothetical protein